MACKAVFIFRFVFGASGEDRAEQKQRKRTEQYSARISHVFKEILMGEMLP